jgi:hypothetical protein
MRALIAAGLLTVCAVARADVTTTASGATVDWSHGVITAHGVGPADRHAPSPAVARDAARVRAEDAARAALGTAAKQLPGVEAGALADAALARAVARATVVAMDVGTDGSVTVALALPIEAVRVAIAGPRRAEPAAGDAPPAVIVDATRLEVTPRVGLAIGAWTGPVLFVDAAPKDGDPRVGDHPVRRTATGLAGAALAIDGDPPAAGALAVVVIRGKS